MPLKPYNSLLNSLSGFSGVVGVTNKTLVVGSALCNSALNSVNGGASADAFTKPGLALIVFDGNNTSAMIPNSVPKTKDKNSDGNDGRDQYLWKIVPRGANSALNTRPNCFIHGFLACPPR